MNGGFEMNMIYFYGPLSIAMFDRWVVLVLSYGFMLSICG